MTVERPLEAVRREIDSIDDAIHDLIMRRTQLVEQVRALKHDWPIKIQPSREAEIIYRLIQRHRGPFPKRDLVAIWRQLIIATLSFEGPFSVAVYMPADHIGYWDLARDQFGAFTPMSRHSTVRSVIEAVRRQEATVGVLPLPRQDNEDPWWRHIVTSHPEAPRIIARLPFAGQGNALGGDLEALAICPVTVTPTGRDRSYLAVDAEQRFAIDQFTAALGEAGLVPLLTAVWNEADAPKAWLYLAEIEGFLADDDARLAQVNRILGRSVNRILPLGGYARPLGLEELGAPAFQRAAIAPIAKLRESTASA
jgi:chorismate mutase